jgi:ureidoglycolate lyase
VIGGVSDRTKLPLSELTPQAFAPYGTVFGKPLPSDAGSVAYSSATSDFWREHVFATNGRDPEILWVSYRSTDPRIDRLEMHKLTEQAVVPLTGDIIQIVAAATPAGVPDLATVRAFPVPVGKGLCMRPGCWHATRVATTEATCMMLTRGATTVDLIDHLTTSAPLAESAYSAVALELSF